MYSRRLQFRRNHYCLAFHQLIRAHSDQHISPTKHGLFLPFLDRSALVQYIKLFSAGNSTLHVLHKGKSSFVMSGFGAGLSDCLVLDFIISKTTGAGRYEFNDTRKVTGGKHADEAHLRLSDAVATGGCVEHPKCCCSVGHLRERQL